MHKARQLGVLHNSVQPALQSGWYRSRRSRPPLSWPW